MMSDKCYNDNGEVMNTIKNYITINKEKIITIFLFLQPIIDVLTAISMTKWNHSFILGLGIRMLFLLLMGYYVIISNKKGRRYLLLVIFYFVLFIGDTLYEKGMNALSYELKSSIKTFYFPIVLLGFYEIFKKNTSFDSEYLKKLFVIYLSFVIIPNLLHLGFQSYEVTKGGNIGFFYTANEIGAILAILMPIFFYHLFQKNNKILNILSILITFYLYLSIGTKAPLILFMVLLTYYFICYIKKLISSKKYKSLSIISVLLVVLFCSFVLIIPKTNFYKNIKVHLEFLEIDKPSDIFRDKKTFDHLIFSERLTFWSNTNKIYKKSGILEKVVGIGYINNYSTDQLSMKMVEMDFVDLFYRHGLLGFIIYMLPVAFLFYQVISKVFADRKRVKKSKIGIAYLFSVIFSLLLSLITGHVILSPSVSIYVALILVLLYNELYKESKI